MFLGAKKMSYSNRHLNTGLVYNDFAPKCTALVPLHLEALFKHRIVCTYVFIVILRTLGLCFKMSAN